MRSMNHVKKLLGSLKPTLQFEDFSELEISAWSRSHLTLSVIQPAHILFLTF